MWGTLGPFEAVPAASPLSQEPRAGADHHPQLGGRLGLDPETRGTPHLVCQSLKKTDKMAHEECTGGGNLSFYFLFFEQIQLCPPPPQ